MSRGANKGFHTLEHVSAQSPGDKIETGFNAPLGFYRKPRGLKRNSANWTHILASESLPEKDGAVKQIGGGDASPLSNLGREGVER